jgi:KaiC/GvpD/RAD55 family RecA-like ATPase
MYELGPKFDSATVAPGTNLLISGPPLTGKRRVALELLATGASAGEGSIIITTRDSADRVIADYRSLLTDPDTAEIGVVDCVTRHQGRSPSETPAVKYTSSPVDMTGIGIKFSEFVETFSTGGTQQNRIALDSLSTLLLYSDLQTVFQFVHVLTNRIEDADALGVHVIESTAHDAEATNTLKQLFDGIIEVDGDRELSVQLPDADPGVVGP